MQFLPPVATATVVTIRPNLYAPMQSVFEAMESRSRLRIKDVRHIRGGALARGKRHTGTQFPRTAAVGIRVVEPR